MQVAHKPNLLVFAKQYTPTGPKSSQSTAAHYESYLIVVYHPFPRLSRQNRGKNCIFRAFPLTFAGMKLWQHRTMGAVDFSGSFAPLCGDALKNAPGYSDGTAKTLSKPCWISAKNTTPSGLLTIRWARRPTPPTCPGCWWIWWRRKNTAITTPPMRAARDFIEWIINV